MLEASAISKWDALPRYLSLQCCQKFILLHLNLHYSQIRLILVRMVMKTKKGTVAI